MKIALDAAAGDVGLAPNLEGAVAAADAWGLEIALVGPASKIQEALRARGIGANDKRFELIDAPDVVGPDEDAAAVRARPKASIMVCAELAASGRAAGLVSAGHSGAAAAAATWHLKRLPGVLRPGIAAPIPTSAGGVAVLLDAGADVDCKPWHLLHFAAMGAIYAERVLGVARPRVGLLSVGEEEGRGNELVKDAIPLLKCSGLEYVGPVEGSDIPSGAADVIVCDGFVGNVAVKLLEGAGASIFGMLREEIGRGWLSKAGALALRGPLKRIKKRMSYDEYGGAPLLGVAGNAVIAHGKSNGKAVANALRVASRLAEAGVNERIARKIEEMKASLEAAKVQI